MVFQILNLCPFNLLVRSCSDAQKYVAKVEQETENTISKQ